MTYELDDGYTVLEDIKNTLRYWKKVRHEMIAKLDNLGAFQLFFTLSCADMRWNENLTALLRDIGMNLSCSVIPDENGFCFTRIVAEYKEDGIMKKRN